MKRGLLIICVLLLSTISTLKAQDYKADFKEIQQEFAERLQITSAHLN